MGHGTDEFETDAEGDDDPEYAPPFDRSRWAFGGIGAFLLALLVLGTVAALAMHLGGPTR